MPRKSRKALGRPHTDQLDEDEGIPYIPPRMEERLLIEYLSSLESDRILCTSHGRGQLAGFLANQNPGSSVDCHYLDSHYAALATEYWEMADDPPRIICAPDFPDDSYSTFCLPIQRQGNAELTREQIQQGYQRLKPQGLMVVAVDNPRDKWVHEQLHDQFKKVTRIPKKQGVIYQVKKTEPLRKERDFSAEFEVPFLDQTLTFQTRPGVFSHRHLDDGAWALIKALKIKNGMNVLDLGCGCGAVGIAAMLSAENVSVTAIDSHSRAVQCTQLNAERNLPAESLSRFQALLTHTATMKSSATYDIVATNPPYFSQFKIAELFINSAKKMLKKSGKLLIVTKMPDWYEEHLPQFFTHVHIHSQGHYHLVEGRL